MADGHRIEVEQTALVNILGYLGYSLCVLLSVVCWLVLAELATAIVGAHSYTAVIPILDTGHFFLDIGHLRICRRTCHPSDQLRVTWSLCRCICVHGRPATTGRMLPLGTYSSASKHGGS